MVVLREFVAAYEALSSGGTPRLPPLPRAYRDVLAEAGHLEEGQREELLDWWRDSLRGAPRRVQFPLGPSRDPGPAGAGVPVHLDEQVTAGLRRLCRTAGASLFTGVAAAFCGALHELTGQSDLVLTTPVATRTDPAAQGVVACLLNTVPVRVRVPTPPQPRALLAEAHRAVVAAVAHSAVPFASIIAAVGATDGGSVSNVMVLHGNAELAELQVGRLHLSRYRIPIVASKHDLALLVTPGARDVHGELEYRSAVFTPSTAERIGGMVLATARGMAAA
jgi:non-ribosomal peptide synthetase component F